jgi:dihydroflavonol-4-reductase
MRAFVTGSTGLLGSNLVRQLRHEGHQVTVLARSRAKAEQVFAGLDVQIVTGDLSNVRAFAPALAGHDTLFHTAAYFREYFQPGDHWATLKALNVDATIELLRAAEAHGITRAVHTSSSGVLGKANPADERTPPDALVRNNLYFRSKLEAEAAITQFLTTSTLRVPFVLPGWMFGPGDSAPTAAGQIVLDFLQRQLPVIIPGWGNPTDARDVAQAMIRAAEVGKSGERYLVSTDTSIAFRELLQVLEEVSGVPGSRIAAPRWFAFGYAWASETYGRLTGKPVLATLDGIRTLVEPHPLSAAKARRELGATFRPLTETLRDTVHWFRAEHPALRQEAESSRSRELRAESGERRA